MKKILFLLLLFSLATVQAQEIQEYKAEVDIKDTVLYESISMTLTNTRNSDITELTYPFYSKLEEIKVYDSNGERLETATAFRGGKTYITTYFKNPVKPNETTTITYEFLTFFIVSGYKDTYFLSTTYSILANVKNFELTLRLPVGAALPEEGVNVVPMPDEVTSDGRHVILKWSESKPTEFRVYVRYEKLYGGYLRYLYYIAFGMIALALLLIFKKRIFLLKRRDVSDKIDILKENEQAILKLVMESEGIPQREIQDATGFSKAKVSKILSELEKRGVVYKKQSGRRNWIYLTEKMKET